MTFANALPNECLNSGSWIKGSPAKHDKRWPLALAAARAATVFRQGLLVLTAIACALFLASLVGLLADRSLANDSTAECMFLGEPARFPMGPWRMAAMLRRPVFFMSGVYLGGNRYELHFELLADFSTVDRGEREAAMVGFERRAHRGIERRAGRLVAAPGARRRTVQVGIAIDQAAVIGPD